MNSLNNLKEGKYEMVPQIECPEGHSEIANEIGQFQFFEFIDCLDSDCVIQVWKCLKCNKLFRVKLE